eukprot:1148394-Pelagomonas_calceolata.AAC.3
MSTTTAYPRTCRILWSRAREGLLLVGIGLGDCTAQVVLRNDQQKSSFMPDQHHEDGINLGAPTTDRDSAY